VLASLRIVANVRILLMIRLLKGNLLALVGLFLGLTTGAAVLMAKHWLVNEVVSALEEEVRASCDCSLAFDSFSLSFTTLKGRARNVRIVEKGIPKLSFKDIRAKVDLSEIREKRVHLSSVVLSQGTADGVGPDSVTFRFIDRLTAPLPPEKQRPDRWRVILDTLEVKDSFLRESFGTSEISGSGVGLFVKRIDETFSLLPSIGDFRYTSYGTKQGEPASELLLGPLSGSIIIEDARTLFNSLHLGAGSSHIEAKAVMTPDENNTCVGSASFTMTPDYIGLPDWIRGSFSGTATISGPIGSPVLAGSMTNSSSNLVTLALPYASQVPLPNFSSDLVVDVNHGDPVVTLSKLLGNGAEPLPNRTTVASTRDLTFSDQGLKAGFTVTVPSFSYGPFSTTNSNAQIRVKEGREGIVTDIDLVTENLSSQGVSLGPSTIKVHLTPNDVEIRADSRNPLQGTLSWRGMIDLKGPEPILTQGNLITKSYRYPLALPVSEKNLGPIALTSQIALKGPLGLDSLTGEGDVTVAFPALHKGIPLSGQALLKDGVLKIALPRSSYHGSADLSVDLVKTLEGKLRFTLPKMPLQEILGYEDPCSFVGANLQYSFLVGQVLGGSGELSVDALSVGCKPYSLTLPANTKIPIKAGALQLKGTALSTLDSVLALDGEIGIPKGFDMTMKGQLELSSLLPLLPSIDDLQGNLKADLSLKGPLSDPTATGSAQLTDGQFGLSTPELGAHHIRGSFTLAGKSIKIEKLDGSVNNGSFSTTGTFLPFDPSSSSLRTTLTEVSVEPIEDASITFSGDLQLGSGATKRKTLSGDIRVTFAEVAKDFDINKIIMSTISGFFLPARAQPTATKQKVEIDLDVKISAPRNIFVLTPFLSAELNANLHTRGNISAPQIDGSMQILSGWIGLKGNRFDITSGGLLFRPQTLLPSIEIASEGSLRAPTGESVLVLLEASGPISSPRIILNSDRGLSQSELLLLLTSSRPLGESTLKARMDSQFGTEQRFFMADDSFSSFSDFFRNLTRIDILSFEPAYNQFTGTIEPAVVARKNISPRLTLLGESLFSSVSNSRAGGAYSLTPSLDINAFFQTVSTQKNSILSSDLTYTVWAQESRFVSFTFEGLKEFNEQSILMSARLGPSSRVLNSDESLNLIQKQIVSYIQDQGFRDAKVQVTCTSADRFCHEVHVSVEEGAPSRISDVRFEGDPLSEELAKKVRDLAPIGDLATTTVLQAIERKLVIALRNEGYIAARISPAFESSDIPSSVRVKVGVELREPISFIFNGNTVFTAKDFLDSIDLFTRKRPFGNNTIKLLIQNIEQMYLEEGYLFVQVSYKEERPTRDRLVYTITITEESPISVRKVSLNGNHSIDRERIISAMTELGLAEQVKALTPTFAIPTQLDLLRDAILTVYQDDGFPNVTVTYSISPQASGDSLDVDFTIVEGEPQRAQGTTLTGYPPSLVPPAKPSSPISLPKLNRYVDTLVQALQAEGFLFPTVLLEPNSDFSTIEAVVEPGDQTIVSSISYEGLVAISENTAARLTTLKTSKPLRTDEINSTKRELLRSGLFSRVEISAQDGTINDPSEGLIIRVVERPLQTLELGVGANSEFGLHTFGEAVNKSLFADGRTLSLRADTYFDEPNINPDGSGLISQGFTSLRYADPKLFGTDYSLTEEARYQRQELSTQEFNLDRFLFGSYLFRSVRSDLTVSAGHSLIVDNLQDVTPGAIISDLDDGTVRLSFLSGIMKLDKRNDPLLPKSGYTVSFEPKVSLEGIGSQANFASGILRSTAIVPLSPLSARYSLGLGFSGGLAQPWGDTEEIPITQRMYLGGRTTVRGFRENSLGPRGDDGAVIGGDTMLAAKTQFQYLAADSFSTHLFFDCGNVWLRHRDFELADIRTSIGLGFQYLSPIGPIGFDVGRPLDEKSGEPSVRVHFSVGSMF
jgi:outer membrane protein insertion porin family